MSPRPNYPPMLRFAVPLDRNALAVGAFPLDPSRPPEGQLLKMGRDRWGVSLSVDLGWWLNGNVYYFTKPIDEEGRICSNALGRLIFEDREFPVAGEAIVFDHEQPAVQVIALPKELHRPFAKVPTQ